MVLFGSGQFRLAIGYHAKQYRRLLGDVLVEYAGYIVGGHGQVGVDLFVDAFGAAGVGFKGGQGGDLAGNGLEPEYASGFVAGFEFHQIVFSHTATGKFGESVAYRLFHFGEGFAGGRVLDHDKPHLTGQLFTGVADAGGYRAAGLYQALVQHGVLALAENRRGGIQCRLVRVAVAYGGDHHRQRGQVNVVFQGHVAIGRQFGGLLRQVFDFGACGD